MQLRRPCHLARSRGRPIRLHRIDEDAQRTAIVLQALDALRHIAEVAANDRLFEVASGTGCSLVGAGRTGVQPVGVDIGMRWLHLIRSCFLDLGRALPPLACADRPQTRR